MGQTIEPGRYPQGGWQLELFNGWHLRRGGSPIGVAPREQRLIALLALDREGRPRTHIAGTLWPESDERHAAASLRECVNRTQHAAPGLLETDSGCLALAAGVAVDVDQFHATADRLLEDASAVDARAALNEMRRADLLPGWYEDWTIFERERIQELRLRGLEALAETQLDGDHGLALASAQVAIRIDPLRERAHRAVMRVHLADGNRTAAVQHFRHFAAKLHDEIGLPPGPEMQELIQPLLAHQGRAATGAGVSGVSGVVPAGGSVAAPPGAHQGGAVTVRKTVSAPAKTASAIDDRRDGDGAADIAGDPWPAFRSAAQAVVDHLARRYPVDLWLASRLANGRMHVVASRGPWAQQAHPGASVDDAQTLCLRMVSGNGPHLAPDTAAVPGYSDIRTGPFARVRGYLGFPVRHGQQLYGTLAAFSSTPQPVLFPAARDETALFARLLSTILSRPAGDRPVPTPAGPSNTFDPAATHARERLRPASRTTTLIAS